jgi:hypothetical protein
VHDTHLFDTLTIDTNNSFVSLASVESSADPQSPLHCDIGSPKCTSSPAKQPQPTTCRVKVNNINNSSPRVLVINIQSINGKREAFWNLVDSVHPEVIIGCETWLSPGIHNSEIIPPGFVTVRKDRPDGYGGVLVSTTADLICQKISIETSSEIVAIKIELVNHQPLVVCAAYRPTNNDVKKAIQLYQDMEKIANRNHSSILWVAGDFNLPGIDWKTISITGHQYRKPINEGFLELICSIGLEQLVDEPTRKENTFDLFLTNRPSFVKNAKLFPGPATTKL